MDKWGESGDLLWDLVVEKWRVDCGGFGAEIWGLRRGIWGGLTVVC